MQPSLLAATSMSANSYVTIVDLGADDSVHPICLVQAHGAWIC